MKKSDPEIRQWLAIRKQEGLKIDPETAEVDWVYGCVYDEYDLGIDLPEELRVVGRIHFARSPGSEIWVEFYDLPETTRETLWEMHRRKLSFPAGLEVALILQRCDAHSFRTFRSRLAARSTPS